MTPERFRRLEVLYDAVVEMDPEARARYIEEQCAGDNEMRRELLAAFDDDSHGLLQNAVEQAARSIAQQAEWHKDQDTNTRVRPDGLPPTLQLAPRGDVAGLEGRRVGQYQVLRLLGRGGMGDVYLAQRADNAFHKQVALKVIRAEVSSSEVVRRFRQEREILAALDHPNVARLLDGGTTDEGWPYFVMEYVEGSPIDQYSDEHKLTVTARLRLFQNVCAAVEYAHQHLIVHRDLKPSNILVTEDGTVKLLDFGIAKLLRTQGEETVYVTRAGTHLMTPEYASPEQVKGETITTATDVYSLGVVLYELLTGHRPYRMRSRALHEIARIICEEEPSRPSTVISRVEQVDTSGQEPTTITPEYVSQVRNVQVTKLKKRLSGDLDTILLLALRKEPQRRYSSVEQLREDLERHVAGLPVRAQIDSLWYRTRKFVQRNRLGVAAAATLGTALIAMGASLWRAQEEQIRAAALQEELTYANRRLGIDQRGATKRHVVRMIPPGWVSPADNGDFAIRLDRKITHSGQSALLIQADGDIRRPEVVSQTIRADHYLGERVRWSAYAKCEGVTQRAALWLRVDAKDRTLAMDDLQRVPIVGTRDWQQYAVVLDVPKDSVVIRLGLLLVGKGKVWFDDLKLETVGPEVRVTDIWRWADPAYKKEANLALRRHSLTQEELDNLPGQPINLQWE